MQLSTCHTPLGFLLRHYLSYRGLHPCLGDVAPLGLGWIVHLRDIDTMNRRHRASASKYIRFALHQLLIDFVELTFLNS